jgi:hypothetical protein
VGHPRREHSFDEGTAVKEMTARSAACAVSSFEFRVSSFGFRVSGRRQLETQNSWPDPTWPLTSGRQLRRFAQRFHESVHRVLRQFRVSGSGFRVAANSKLKTQNSKLMGRLLV